MRLCLTDDEGSFKTIEVSSTLEIENLAPLIELELQIPASRQLLYSNGTQLIDTKRTLASYKINQDDIILVRNHGPAPSTASMSKAEMTRQQILADPDLQRRLIMQNPAIAGALTSPDQFERVFNEMSRQRAAYEQQSQQEMRNLQNADSMDVEAQKRIAEEIRKANVAQNMERAIEYHPESFGRGKGVDLLFGLDMLKRHLACIDLASNVLRINHEEVPFLPEHELPDKAKLEASGSSRDESTNGASSSAAAAGDSGKVATQTTQPSASTHAVPTASTFSETSIQSLVDLGATREQAINALEACGGNVDMAAGLIL
ncbi:hypothetical protein BATDEDRAFT_27827 [Batrachochytrium dendrobatidis JAM81]|uniref:DNA damage-inducible protein 1 n=1 Tax=Batrachochytrium dendrobatidis (strain JAM81 / FGSC 10211) TaxID=684364 RepID=F4PC80_BATDJ|nr:uncharacterized protein BATDEDRAFT_27827 [Batrachochytrium dendrobatidis JAM81]EGF77177.1 hypothetical protein BATDEDRAFT_27827 [Batrachochytrium dendrobatidis JAM81]|eukprot:XP_006682174.1 hypothetical protein BATDEDRAFT_27827 [Batrachochytrium dendrobatidis JAM81]